MGWVGGGLGGGWGVGWGNQTRGPELARTKVKLKDLSDRDFW